VVERRNRVSERAQEQDLSERARDEVFAAHHLCNFHQCIVHRAGELVGGDAILSPDEEVTKVVSRDRQLVAKTPILENNGLVQVDAETPVEMRVCLKNERFVGSASARVEGLLFVRVGSTEGGG